MRGWRARRDLPAAACLALVFAGVNALTCNTHLDCATRPPSQHVSSFCNSVPYGRVNGVCEPCWKCCLYPERFTFPALSNTNNCSQSCSCNLRKACDYYYDCAPGLFCGKPEPLSVPICMRCTDCDLDSRAVSGSCAHACPAGAVLPLAGPGASVLTRDALVYLASALEPWRGPGSNRSMAKRTELAAFLRNETALDKLINSTFSYNDTYVLEAVATVYRDVPPNSSVPLMTVVERFSHGSRSLLCPKLDPAAPASSLPAITGPGCPCNATEGARSHRCPAGFRCSRRSYLGLSTDAMFDPAWAALPGVCVGCDAGQYCAEGVYLQPAAEMARSTRDLDCPLGSYCPSPGEVIICPDGFFCGPRAQFPTTCNYTELLSTPEALIRVDGETDIVTRLKKGREPIRGNYCPEGSSKPGNVCAGGYYCPSASDQIICPRGHYCKPQSIYPIKCPPLTSCGEGTDAPDGRPLAGLIFGLIVVCMYLLQWVAQGLMLVMEQLQRHLALISRMYGGGGWAAVKEKDAEQQAAAAQAAKQVLADAQSNTFDVTTMGKREYWGLEDKINIRFRDVRGRVAGKDKVHELAGVSGLFEAGQLSAIMGPSGCGKTTLIRVLAGRAPASVSVFNDQRESVALTETRYRRQLGYVPQDDILHPDLTVRENLEYSARLKLPRSLPGSQRHAIVDDTLCMLGMFDKQDRLTGSVDNKVISGGERKRVSIGVEVVGKPPILFMDEPTSGLDAARSSELVSLLSNLSAFSLMNIIAVIHQPRYSSFILFDKLMLLAPGGKMLFQGPPKLVVPYFEILGFRFPAEENHADTVLDVVAEPSLTSDRGLRVAELPIAWATRGEAWLANFSNPVERMRRAVQAVILSNRMAVMAQQAHMLERAAGSASKRVAHKKAVGAAGAQHGGKPVMLAVWGARKYKPERDALAEGERREWLDKKLAKLFPKHELEHERMARQIKAQAGYEKGFVSGSSSSSASSECSEPDAASEASELAGKILLLKHPNKGDQINARQADLPTEAPGCGPGSHLGATLRDWKDHFVWGMLELRWLVHRNLVKSTRAFWPGTVLDVLLLQGAAFIVGVVQGTKWGLSNVPSNFVMAYLVLSVLSTVTHLRTFSVFRSVQLRERMSGVSSSATFLASNLTDLGWIFLSPAVYFAIYYFLTLPRASFNQFYLIGVLVCWWSSGLSYVISVSTIPPQAQLISTVILTLILGAFLHGMSPTIRSSRGGLLEVVLGTSYNRWAMEAATIEEFKMYYEYKSNEIIMLYYSIGLCNMDRTLVDDGDDSLSSEEALSFVALQRDFDANGCNRYSSQAYVILFCMGLGLRLIAFGQMLYQSHEQYFQVVREQLWSEVNEATGIRKAVDFVMACRRQLIKGVRRQYRESLQRVVDNIGQGGATSGLTHAPSAGAAASAGASPSRHGADSAPSTAPVSPRTPAAAPRRVAAAGAAHGADRV